MDLEERRVVWAESTRTFGEFRAEDMRTHLRRLDRGTAKQGHPRRIIHADVIGLLPSALDGGIAILMGRP